MNVRSLIAPILAVAVLWVIADKAMADVCKYRNGVQPVKGNIPLQISALSVGRDMPVGTEVFRQRFSVAQGQTAFIECFSREWFDIYDEGVISLTQKTSMQSGPYAGGIYKTNIEGLGVVIKSGAILWPFKTPKRRAPCDFFKPSCDIDFNHVSEVEMVLIKVGDVKPGMLQGSALPTFTRYFYPALDPRMVPFEVGFSGSIQIVSNTCQTPNVSVDMGKHNTKEFAQVGSGTAWKDFTINLNNCPAFHGVYATNASTWISQSGTNPSGIGTAGAKTPNSLSFRIDPARTPISVNDGVLSLNPIGVGGAPAASGVGVQIAVGSSNTPLRLGVVRDSGLILNATQSSYGIALSARYLRTSAQMSPGPADASATFTIIYH